MIISSASRAGIFRGFTLIEVMVALVLAGVIIAALAGGLGIGFRARESARRAIDSSRTRSVMLQIIRNDFELAPRPDNMLTNVFLADGESLIFRTASGAKSLEIDFGAKSDLSPTATQTTKVQADVQEVEYRLEASGEDPNELSLVRIVRRNLVSQVEAEGEQEVLAQGVRRLNFRYFDGEDWLEAWDVAFYDNQLPLAVEMTCEFDDESLGATVAVFRLPMSERRPFVPELEE